LRTIHHVFSVSARPDRVFGALTSGEGLSGWWTTKVDVERHVGGHVRFTFGGAFNPDMEITMLREPESLEWRCVSSHENWTGNTFRFEPEPEGGSTRVRFWQHYARELADDDYGIYNYNWGYYLESLRLYCETGTGMPFDAEAGPASHEWTDPATPEGEPIMQARHRPRRSSPEQMATASRIRVRSALREPPRLTSRPRNSWYSGTARGGSSAGAFWSSGGTRTQG
jgi:uncharacterized protein YndB with AHSA1/START domain